MKSKANLNVAIQDHLCQLISDLLKFQDPKRKVHKPVKGVLKLEIEKLPASSAEVENTLESGSLAYDSLDHGDHLTDSASMKRPTNGSFSKSKSFEMKELVRNGSIAHENVENSADDVSVISQINVFCLLVLQFQLLYCMECLTGMFQW